MVPVFSQSDAVTVPSGSVTLSAVAVVRVSCSLFMGEWYPSPSRRARPRSGVGRVFPLLGKIRCPGVDTGGQPGYPYPMRCLPIPCSRVVFLDVDGVLNTPATIILPKENPSLPAWFPHPPFVAALNRVFSLFPYGVVFNLSNRRPPSLAALRAMASVSGLSAPVLGCVPRLGGGRRGEAVSTWLSLSRPADYLVVDRDRVEMGKHLDRLVWCAAADGEDGTGFGEEKEARAVRLLAPALPFPSPAVQ